MKTLFSVSMAPYKRWSLKHDSIAALVVTAIAIPESLGYAAVVGLPPVTGLYTALVAPLVFALFASTRRLIVGADSATAALIASGAALIAGAGSRAYPGAVAVLGIVTAALLLLMAVFRLGFLADLISRPVLVGFLAGVGVQLIVMKLPSMLGLEARGDTWQHFLAAAGGLTHSNLMSVTVAILVIGIILVCRRTRVPGALVGLVVATLFAVAFHVQTYGVALVGALPNGLPSIAIVLPSIVQIITLLPAALSIAIVILAQSSVVIRNSANEHDEPVNLNRDLMALGVSNLAAAWTHGFIANGSPPRTLAADSAGQKSQLTNILMSVIIGVLLLVGGSLFQWLPEAALAAVVCMLGFSLIRLRELQHIWQTHRTEFFVAMVALVGTAYFGVRQGVLIAVVVSLMERLSRQYHPKDAILLRDGELSEWAQERLGESFLHDKFADDLLVYSFDGSLFFENITYCIARINRAIDNAKTPVHAVVIDAGAIDSIDYTAVEAINVLYRHLSGDGVTLGFAHVSPNLLDKFKIYGIIDLIGAGNIYPTLAAALTSHPGGRRSVADMMKDLKLDPLHYVIVGAAVLEVLGLRETTDVDVAVDADTYARFRDEEAWREYIQDNGKKILSAHGFNMMQVWMGSSFSRLKREAFIVDGVSLMSVARLIKSKRHLGRKKDKADIKLLEKYLTEKS